MKSLQNHFSSMPVIAILRGVTPDEAVTVADAIIQTGITILEVPLNSPEPYESITRLKEAFPNAIIGAGTVLSVDEVDRVKVAGGSIIVSPNTDPEVIAHSVQLGLTPMPGFQTVSEAFVAIKAGAKYLKLFPAGSIGPDYIKAIKAVLPADIKLLAVGGAGAKTLAEWHTAGTDGYGIGSELYKPGKPVAAVSETAQNIVEAYKSL